MPSKAKKLSLSICLSDQQGCRYGEVNVVEWGKEKNQQILIYLFIYLFIYLDVLICVCILMFAMALYASVYMGLVVTCWERTDLLALVCGVLL